MIRIGQKLREIRIEKGLSLEDVAKATKIRPAFLSAIEKGEYHKLPSSAYAQGFVNNYAQFMGIPKREAMALFRREFDPKKETKVLPDGFTTQNSYTLPGIRISRRLLAILLFFVAFTSYLAFQYRYSFLNPPLSVKTPEQGKTYQSDLLVEGTTDANATVVVNNSPATMTKTGDFSKKITVFSGDVIITIKAKNRFGKETVITREIHVR